MVVIIIKNRPSIVASKSCYTGETMPSQFQVYSTPVSSSCEVTDTNKGKKRTLEEEEVVGEEVGEDVDDVPIFKIREGVDHQVLKISTYISKYNFIITIV
jgi:hypothetical protein